MYNNMCEYDIQFEAGTTQFFRFNLFDIYGVPLNIEQIKVNKFVFKMARLGSSECIFKNSMEKTQLNIIYDENKIPYIEYEIGKETEKLCGLYEYQCYLVDGDGKTYTLERKKIAYIQKSIN